MDFGSEEIDADEDCRQEGREAQYPLVLPAAVDDYARQRKKETVPQACLSHCAERRPLQRYPHYEDVSKKGVSPKTQLQTYFS